MSIVSSDGHKWFFKWFPWVIALGAFLLYLKTLAPTVDFIDCGELATSATLLWIPHPTGYPLFLLIGHLFARLPFGSEEIVRLNIMSAFFCALGVGVFACFLKQLFDTINERKVTWTSSKAAQRLTPVPPALSQEMGWVLASFGALVLALSRSYWITATAAEVYPLYVFLLSANLYLFTRFIRETDKKKEKCIGHVWAFVLGISFTNHLSIVLLSPAFVIAFLWRYRSLSEITSRIRLLILPFLLGLLPLVFLLLRALTEPPMNWVFPVNPSTFWAHITGARYQEWMFNLNEALPKNFPIFWSNLPGQFGYLAFLVAVIGFIYLLLRERLVFVFTLLLFLSCFSYAVAYDISEIEPFFLQCYLVVSVWAMCGTYALAIRIPHTYRQVVIVIVAAAIVAASGGFNFYKADRSANYMPADFMVNLLSDAEPGAVIFSSDYNRISSVFMYFHYVRGIRPDVTIIEVPLLSERWYLRTLEKYHPHIYSREMNLLFEELTSGQRKFTAEEYKRGQIYLIMDRIYGNHPLYFESTVEHLFIPQGYQIAPMGLLYQIYREEELVRIRPFPQKYRFRDISYPDYNADKIRNIYMTMLYANGIHAERMNLKQQAQAYYDYAASFFPAQPELVSRHREGHYLRNRKQEVDRARERLKQSWIEKYDVPSR